MHLAEILFPIPVHQSFDYKVPEDLRGKLTPGQRVMAPFGKRGLQMGVVKRLHSTPDPRIPLSAYKPVNAAVDDEPVLSDRDLALAAWLSDYYFSSPGEAAFAVLPIGKHRAPKRPA